MYQAYPPHIAGPAVAAQRFVPPFKLTRMTWIKPSFCWMMYRCGFASKPNQERVLAVDVARDEFDGALSRASLSHFDPRVYATPGKWEARRDASPVRVQWDPERDILLERLPYRSIQMGLGPEVAAAYASDWIVRIEDVTELAVRLGGLPEAQRRREAAPLLEAERPYALPPEAARHLTPGLP